MSVPELMEPSDIAEQHGCTEEAVFMMYRSGDLIADAKSACGLPLTFRWRVDRDVPRLLEREPVRARPKPPRRRSREFFIAVRSLPCGCALAPDNGGPVLLCRDATALDQARRLTTALTAAMPGDAFLSRLAEACGAALDRHLREPDPAKGEEPILSGCRDMRDPENRFPALREEVAA